MSLYRRMRNRAFLTSSIVAMSAVSANAYGACSPDPTIPAAQTICSGTDSDGLSVMTTTNVLVQSGALVLPGSGSASITLASINSLRVSGTVDGNGVNGVLVTNTAPYWGMLDPYAGASPSYGQWGWIYPGAVASIMVDAGATISGSSAIRLAQRPDNSQGSILLTLDNSGTLTGTAGPALVLQAGTSINYMRNYATGVIGGISGNVGSLINDGIIDGGAGSAIQNMGNGPITNLGTIRSTSGNATLSLQYSSISNTGLIANYGSGSAIQASSGLYLDNRGDIVGSIRISGSQTSTIDTSQGTVSGDIVFDGGDDLFYGGAYDPTLGRFANVSGTVDGGAGIDTVALTLTQNARLNGANMPLNFERFQFTLGNDARVELNDGFNLDHGVGLGGTGTLVINRDATSEGSLVTGIYGYPSTIGLINNGNLTANMANASTYAISLSNLGLGENNGTITSVGGAGLLLSTSYGNSNSGFTNKGTIVADGTAVSMAGTLTNTGTIRSNGGIAVINSYTTAGSDSSNSGNIEGKTAGVRIDSASFVNSGTISASSGLGVDLGYNARFDNRAGGIVTGTTAAIGVSGYAYQTVVRNAGTINGDVRLISNGGYDSANDIFIDNGGTVNGNLLLGGGDDYLITDFNRQGNLAGVTGTIDAGTGFDTIRYRVNSDVTTTLIAPTGFEAVGFELADSHTLDLQSAAFQDLALSIGGKGKATINADLSQTDHVVLDLAPVTTAQLVGDGSMLRNELTVTSKGNISVTSNNGYAYGLAAVNAGTATFENAGTISVTGSGDWYQPYAIMGGKLVTNSGSIALDGATGISGTTRLINNGTVRQESDARSSSAIIGVSSIVNNGTISVDGTAIAGYGFFSSAPKIENSGLIESRADIAISSSYTSIVNQASGMIRGQTMAITGESGMSVVNAGTIEGDVVLGSPYGWYGSRSTYVANGGTLNGDLRFGSTWDVLLTREGMTGVSGTIDAGDGFDLFGRFYTANASTTIGGALPTSFEGELVESIGPNSVVTLTGADGGRGLRVAGDGQIVNRAIIGGLLVATYDASMAADGIGVLSSFINEGRLDGGFTGVVHSFSNKGMINGSVDLGLEDATARNEGTINGDVRLSSGDERFIQKLSAQINGSIYGGSGNDTVLLDMDAGGTLDATSFEKFVEFEHFGVTGSGPIATQGLLQIDTLQLDGQFELQAGSTLQTLGPVAVTGSTGPDHLINHGTIIGDVDLGDGDDRFDFYQGSSVSGIVSGGTGANQLSLYYNNDGTRQAIDLSPYQQFQRLTLEGGIGTLAGNISFDHIDVNAGRLIGLPGSTISASNGVTVANGATFGSAGTVNGAISVNGVLSPGASPGTMTINGNVALNAGSITMFEMTPTVSDAVVINGKLAIGSGSTFQLTGERPLTPGIVYDLITASDGISGQFTTIDKATSVLGFIRQTDTAIQLLGQFQLPVGANAQVARTVDYVNGLLVAGTASTGLLDAAPTMIDGNGAANPQLFARLNPEAYASVLQTGVENGLALSVALRSTAFAAPAENSNWFGFGQAFGAWRRLPGYSLTGVSTANVRTSGLFGGIGYGTQDMSFGVFVGHVDARQNMRAIGASNDADGIVAGAMVKARSGNFDLSLAMTYDDSKTDTKRSIMNAMDANSRYKLRTWTTDFAAAYRFPVGDGLSLKPQIGFTHIESRRAALSEAGNEPFLLEVTGKTLKANFISGDLYLGADAVKRVRPWLSVGIRHQLSGRVGTAIGAFMGNSETFTVTGASRDRTLATVSGGAALDVLDHLTLSLSGRTEFGAKASGQSAMAGLRLTF